MAATLQIRNVPEEVHTAVRVRSQEAGLSVWDYLLNLVSELVTRPTMAEPLFTLDDKQASAGGRQARVESF